MFESTALDWVEIIVTGIELLAILIIIVTIITATVRFLYGKVFRKQVKVLYKKYRRGLAQAILTGLEILIAADVIRTVVLDRTIQAIAVLGLLVLVRIILSWSIIVEMNNRWPWQPKTNAAPEDEDV
jgi:uncharacterized membrane protein